MMTAAEEKPLKPTVFVVDDDEAVRTAIADLIEAMELAVRTFASAEEFLALYNADMAGCLVLDLKMPQMGGLELQAILTERGIKLPVIVITGHGDIAASVRSMKLGAVDFLEKPFRQQALADCIKKALELDAAQRFKKAKIKDFNRLLSLLTVREKQMMDLIISGKTDKEIAAQTMISQRGVAFHRLHILEKMQVSSAVELTRLAAESDYIKKPRS